MAFFCLSSVPEKEAKSLRGLLSGHQGEKRLSLQIPQRVQPSEASTESLQNTKQQAAFAFESLCPAGWTSWDSQAGYAATGNSSSWFLSSGSRGGGGIKSLQSANQDQSLSEQCRHATIHLMYHHLPPSPNSMIHSCHVKTETWLGKVNTLHFAS